MLTMEVNARHTASLPGVFSMMCVFRLATPVRSWCTGGAVQVHQTEQIIMM